MTTRTSRRRSWKREESHIAARLGGERVPVNGRQRGSAPDIVHNWLSPEVKSRKTPLLVLKEGMDQAVKSAAYSRRKDGVDRLPIVVYHVTGTHLDNAYVVMRLADFEDWFGDEVREAG